MFRTFLLLLVDITLVLTEDIIHISACQGQPTKMIRCQNGEIIFVESAVYGSFRKGDCGLPVKQECQANVTRYIESKCSGLEKCNVTAADDYLMSNTHTYNPPCDKSFAKSLEVQFQCKKYYNIPKDECGSEPIVVTSKHGFLSSLLTKQTGKGSQLCPWSFIVSESQTLLLSLWDFGVWTYGLMEENTKSLIYAHVRSLDFVTTVCPGRDNKRLFYTKSDSTVNVMMQYGEGRNYLIEFKIIDCPIYISPKFLKNVGGNGSSLLLKCNEGNRKVFSISCVNGSWPQMTRSSCSITDETTMTLNSESHLHSHSTLLIIGVIALAIIISLLIIFVGLYCLKACPFQNDHDTALCSNSATSRAHQITGKYSSENLFLQTSQSMRELYPMLANHDHRVTALQRDYATTLQMRQMAGHYGDNTGWCPAHGLYYLGSIDGKCNTLKMKRNLSIPLSNCKPDLYSDKTILPVVFAPSSPFYHELDQITLKSPIEPKDRMLIETSSSIENV